VIGAIEAGGTKMVCAVGRTWQEVRDTDKFVVPTTTPNETMSRIMRWFSDRNLETPLEAIGIASFGPIDFESNRISMSTPKVAWRGASWRQAVVEHLGDIPLGYDTDTNGAGLAEWRWGAAQGRRVVVYVTIGTGIGGGLIIDGAPVHGLLHPEFGHMTVQRQSGDQFPGNCPSHGDCLEGLASGAAIKERWGRSGSHFPPDHPAWELESGYLAMAMVNIVTITSAEIIILSGGVMSVEGLLDKVRAKTRTRMAGYIAKVELEAHISEYLVAPGLGGSSGVVGAFALGMQAATITEAGSRARA
jgi:fructokinase